MTVLSFHNLLYTTYKSSIYANLNPTMALPTIVYTIHYPIVKLWICYTVDLYLSICYIGSISYM